MGMGIPVAHGVAGESAAIVEREGIGLCFEPENATALYETIVALTERDDLHQKFRLAGPPAARRYDRRILASHMRLLLEKVTGSDDVEPD